MYPGMDQRELYNQNGEVRLEN
uniref:Uncharacterized protein n=1 Tax=Arundo donax TaxID=35708 RepID=A0A0A9C9T2_ARUDO